MNSRERVLTALAVKQPDRVPFMEAGVDRELQVQIMGCEDFAPAELASTLNMDAIPVDLFPPLLVASKQVGARSFVSEPLLTSREALSLIELPDVTDPAYYDDAKRMLDANKGDYAIGARIRLGASTTLVSMGLEAFSYALVDCPDLIDEALKIYTEWSGKLVERLPGIGADFIWSFDDIAYKTGLMFAPHVFREVFMPPLRHVAEAIHSTGLPWVYHSDGNLMSVLDDLVSLGINGLHPLEPGPMDIVEVKRMYGDRLCLVGNIDLHYTLTRGTPEEVDAEVRERIATVGRGGGYIVSSSNSITSYCKVENVLAMMEAVGKYGDYRQPAS